MCKNKNDEKLTRLETMILSTIAGRSEGLARADVDVDVQWKWVGSQRRRLSEATVDRKTGTGSPWTLAGSGPIDGLLPPSTLPRATATAATVEAAASGRNDVTLAASDVIGPQTSRDSSFSSSSSSSISGLRGGGVTSHAAPPDPVSVDVDELSPADQS